MDWILPFLPNERRSATTAAENTLAAGFQSLKLSKNLCGPQTTDPTPPWGESYPEYNVLICLSMIFSYCMLLNGKYIANFFPIVGFHPLVMISAYNLTSRACRSSEVVNDREAGCKHYP
jgi:hypothetical protein